MLYAGYLVTRHDASFLAVVAAGVGGNTVGSILIWAVGATGGRRLLEQHGRWIGIRTRHLDRADSWFANRGGRAVLTARFLPIVRTFILLPAGVARMSLVPFTACTVLGCVPFVGGFAWLGVVLGPRWQEAHGLLRYFDGAVVGGCVIVVLLVAIRAQKRKAAIAAA